MKTKVIFRKHSNGEVFALFPREAGTLDPATCMSYAHVGQHSSADVLLCTRRFALAKPREFAPLARELRRIGYKLAIAKRTGYADMKARQAQIACLRAKL